MGLLNKGKFMENLTRIASFSVNHDFIDEGIYVSRIDGDVTTYDMRTRRPNMGDYMDNVTMHSVEHLFATYVRNSEMGSRVIYFGPMGCRTGFYLLLAGDLTSKEVLPLVRDCFRFVADFRGEVPGASAKDCGNYLDMNLPMANYWGRRYSALLGNLTEDRLVYPE